MTSTLACSIEGCTSKSYVRTWCSKHYSRWMRHGSTNPTRIVNDDAARFWQKVNKTNTCWLWVAYVAPDGYGKFCLNNNNIVPHRYAYELLVGPIPKGLVLDHLCRVRNCVNPDHLEPVTQQENNVRGIRWIHPTRVITQQ